MAYKYEQWLLPENLERIKGWARDGLIDEDIAHNMHVNPSTLRRWKNDFKEISDALRLGKDSADRIVESALYRKAIGYDKTLKKPIKVRRVAFDDNGRKIEEYEEIIYAEETIHIPADTTAQIFWLKNRKPEQWRDKADMAVTPSNGVLESLLELKRDK